MTSIAHNLTHGLLAAGLGLLALVASADAPADATSIQQRIDAAQPGQTIELPAGVFHGSIIIDKPLTLVGARAEPGTVIDGGSSGDVVRITAPDVTIRNLTIRGTGDSLDRENAGVTVLAPRARILHNTLTDVLFGVYLKEAPDAVIEHNTIGGKQLPVHRRGDGIRLWYSEDCAIRHNTVHHSRDVVMWFSDRVTLQHNTVTDGRYGLHFMYSDGNVITDNLLRDNSVGAFLMYSSNLTLLRNSFIHNRGPSGYGVGLKDMDGLKAEHNRFLGNRVGIYLDNSPSSVGVVHHFRQNLIAYNDIGVAFLPMVRHNQFSDNNFLENVEQVAVLGSGDFHGKNEFTVAGRGNYWSDYGGYDRAGDGIGDVPYTSASLFENLMDRDPKLRLFLFSPAQQAIELASEAFPAFRPRPKVTDSAPLMRPVAIAAPPIQAPPTHTMWLAGLGLLAAGGATLALAGRGLGRGLGRRTPDRAPANGVTTPGPHHAAPAFPTGASHTQEELDMNDRHDDVVLSVHRLTKRFGRFTAVDGLDLEVRRGEAVALWGVNGAGKTTAIRCVLGLLRCVGDVHVCGHDLGREGKQVRRMLGYVPQEQAFYDEWRTREIVLFFARLKRVPASRVDTVLEDVGLTTHRRKRVAALSGGMKQRLALACALLADPPLLVPDEITSSLDAAARRDFMALLRGLRSRGKAILFTSHRLDEVEALADRVVVLDAGRRVAETPPHRLADTIGLRSRLRLVVEGEPTSRVTDALRAAGFDAEPNGRGVYVHVSPARKAEPIHALAASGITVASFDLESGGPTNHQTTEGDA